MNHRPSWIAVVTGPSLGTVPQVLISLEEVIQIPEALFIIVKSKDFEVRPTLVTSSFNHLLAL